MQKERVLALPYHPAPPPHQNNWLLRALIYGLIGYFRSKLSDLNCLITNIKFCNWTGQIGQLCSQ